VSDVMIKACECGCGGTAPIATRNYTVRGWVKGLPLRFIHGHNVGLVPPAERFKAFVRVDDQGCHVWTGGQCGNGYGEFSFQRRPVRAHKWNWEQVNGPVQKGLELDHLCRNRLCVNPAHLEAVTKAVNVQRGEGPQRAAMAKQAITHCPKGHPYDEENTRYRKNGHRACRTCERARCLANYHKRRQAA